MSTLDLVLVLVLCVVVGVDTILIAALFTLYRGMDDSLTRLDHDLSMHILRGITKKGEGQ
jgi:hypothetical protein